MIEPSGSCARTCGIAGIVMASVIAFSPALRAQPAPTNSDMALAAAAVAQADVVSGTPATLTFANRPILQFRATLLGRRPNERVIAAQLVLERFVEARVTGPIEVRSIGDIVAVAVAGRDVFAILPADVDTLTGETLAEVAELARTRLQTALNEAAEIRRPRQMLVSGLQALLGSAVLGALFWGVVILHRRSKQWLAFRMQLLLQRTGAGHVDFARSARLNELLHNILRGATWIVCLFLGYLWLTFTFRRFPYTRPWGESLRSFIFEQFSVTGEGILNSIPGLFMVLVILLLTRFVARIVQLLFQGIEAGRLSLPWIYPETAQPTRKLFTLGIWLFGIALAYPHLPGSNSEAFRGLSVFVGLVVSLGSSGLVNQVMSGFTLTYSRALRQGDFVQVADTIGTVEGLGTLSTKIKTARGEDVTIPNAVMVSNTVTNYTRFADEGVFVPTTISIGYDVPWRQVQALLLLAASRTPGVRGKPAPVVRQPTLAESYVQYTLFFCLERPAERAITLAAVNTSILDAFNEYGVQITSPNYEGDPEKPKIVPRDQWFAAPATSPDEPAG